MNKKIFLKAKLFSWLFIIIAVIGLIFMPLLPWITYSDGEITQIRTEAIIHESARPYIAILEGQEILEEYTSIDDFSLDEIPSQILDTIGLSRSLSQISTMFWLSIFFGIIIFVGLALYKLQKRYETLSHIFLLVGCLSLIPAILILVGHVQFILHLSSLEAAVESSDYSLMFSYNYVPLIMGFILLICTSLYTKTVFSPALTYFKTIKNTAK